MILRLGLHAQLQRLFVGIDQMSLSRRYTFFHRFIEGIFRTEIGFMEKLSYQNNIGKPLQSIVLCDFGSGYIKRCYVIPFHLLINQEAVYNYNGARLHVIDKFIKGRQIHCDKHIRINH